MSRFLDWLNGIDWQKRYNAAVAENISLQSANRSLVTRLRDAEAERDAALAKIDAALAKIREMDAVPAAAIPPKPRAKKAVARKRRSV